jgi:FixJ family two-component response regulator
MTSDLSLNSGDEVILSPYATKVVDVILIDDDQLFLTAMDLYLKNLGISMEKYSNPKQFLARISQGESQYNKNTKIFMDHNFGGKQINGFELAAKLYKEGFTKLYILSGTEFEREVVPEYVTVILKSSIDDIHDAIVEKT